MNFFVSKGKSVVLLILLFEKMKTNNHPLLNLFLYFLYFCLFATSLKAASRSPKIPFFQSWAKKINPKPFHLTDTEHVRVMILKSNAAILIVSAAVISLSRTDVGVTWALMEMSLCICSVCHCSEVWVSLRCSPGFCLSSYTVSPLSPQDYESKLQALQKQVETRSLAAETTEEEEEEEEEGEFEAENNLATAKPKGIVALVSSQQIENSLWKAVKQ